MEQLTLNAATRDITGKKVRLLRRQGITPIHVYGKDIAPMTLQTSSAAIQRLVARAGRNLPVSVSVEGTTQSHLAFIREIQRDPVNESILHVDFLEVPLAETMRAEVPVYLVGDAPAVKVHSGTLFQALRSIEVECLPLNLPQFVEVDVSGLDDFEKAITVSTIHLGETVTILTSPEELIARVNPPRVAEEEEGAPAEAKAAEPEGAAEAEGEEKEEKQPRPRSGPASS